MEDRNACDVERGVLPALAADDVDARHRIFTIRGVREGYVDKVTYYDVTPDIRIVLTASDLCAASKGDADIHRASISEKVRIYRGRYPNGTFKAFWNEHSDWTKEGETEARTAWGGRAARRKHRRAGR